MTPGLVVCWSGYEPRLQTIRLPPEGLVFGREHASATDERISRQHVRVRVEGPVVHLEDLGSRNGTYINKWRKPEPARESLPAVVRAGHTVFAVIPDLEIYEELHEGRCGAALERARAEVAAAALAEQNVTIEAGNHNAVELMRSYCATVGGEMVIYQPSIDAPSLDASLTDTKPRVVVLQLTASALSFADMPTVKLWLETDVRFVTVMWPGSNALSMVDPTVVARLRERVIRVANPRYDELPFRVRDIVTTHAPNIRIHASVCEGMLLKAHQFDEEWVVPRFTKAVIEWYGSREPDCTLLQMRDLIHAIEPPPSAAHCVCGVPRRASSFLRSAAKPTSSASIPIASSRSASQCSSARRACSFGAGASTTSTEVVHIAWPITSCATSWTIDSACTGVKPALPSTSRNEPRRSTAAGVAAGRVANSGIACGWASRARCSANAWWRTNACQLRTPGG